MNHGIKLKRQDNQNFLTNFDTINFLSTIYIHLFFEEIWCNLLQYRSNLYEDIVCKNEINFKCF